VADFKVLAARAQAALERLPFNRWTAPDGPPFLEFYRASGGFLLRFPDNADFEVAAGTFDVVCTPALDVPQATCEHLYINQVLPLVLAGQGKLVLHGSAVVADGRGLAFMAQSGRGKSTIAAAFAIAGSPFLTDDGLLLEPDGAGYRAMPSHASIRLWEDSHEALVPMEAQTAPPVHYTSKARIIAGDELAHSAFPAPLGAIYCLGPGEAQQIKLFQFSSADAVNTLLHNSFILDIGDRLHLGDHFSRLAHLAASVPCFHLDYPRCYEELPRVLTRIREHAASLGGQP
jgi:hypothetical protein